MQELSVGRGIVFDFCRPADSQRIARAAEMRGDELCRLIRRTARPGPTGMIPVVRFRRTEDVEPAKRVECRDLLFRGGGNTILRQQFADGAVLAFGGGAVVAPDIENECGVAVAEPVNFINDATDL